MAAALGPCFSAIPTPKIIATQAFRSASSKASYSTDTFSIVTGCSLTQKLRSIRISAAVAQDEVAVDDQEKSEEEEVEILEELPSSTVNTKLYFGNLPYSCDSAQLAGIIQDYANPEMVEVIYDRESGSSRGFAFATMSSVEDCELVIQNLDGSQYGGRIMRVNLSDKPKQKEPLYQETEYKLFVGNLSWTVTSENLNEVFQEYGNVVGSRVLYDRETGQSRGYGFVCYSSKAEMDAALETLDGVELEGRAMRISLAIGKRS